MAHNIQFKIEHKIAVFFQKFEFKEVYVKLKEIRTKEVFDYQA